VAYNDNVSPEFAGLVRRMMAKKVDQRPKSMWEFLKEYRTIEVFKKKPKPPEVSVFDDMPSIKSADDMFKRNKKKETEESAKSAEEKPPEEKPAEKTRNSDGKPNDRSSPPSSTPNANK